MEGRILAYLSVMKTLVTLLFIIVSTMAGIAQDSWKVTHNGKIRLEASSESERNSFVIKRTDLKVKGSLSIFIKENAPQKGWIRTVLIVDDAENELISGKGDLVKIENARLARASARSNIVKIYSLTLPSDPAQAALIRVRRIHLATIQIK